MPGFWVLGTTPSGEQAAANLALVARIDYSPDRTSATLRAARDGQLVPVISLSGESVRALGETLTRGPLRWYRVDPLDSMVGGSAVVNLDLALRVMKKGPALDVVGLDGVWLASAREAEDRSDLLAAVGVT